MALSNRNESLEESVSITFRLPKDLARQVRVNAAGNFRTVSSELRKIIERDLQAKAPE